MVLLAGHTDAKGGDAYNKDLSDRRADAVKQFLVTKYGLPAENLIAIGYGKERLKNTADPFAAEKSARASRQHVGTITRQVMRDRKSVVRGGI